MPADPRAAATPPGRLGGTSHALDLTAPANALRAARAAAREVAARALAEHGFAIQTDPDEHWKGSLQLPRSGVRIAAEVRLPPPFPDALPRVAVPQNTLQKRVAHVLVGGTLCLVPTSNVLIDADQPAALVTEALRRATDVLDQGLLGETDADLEAEYQAYWVPTDLMAVLSLCDAEGPARHVVICQLSSGSKLIDNSPIIAEAVEAVEGWAKHVGAKIGSFHLGLFIPVNASVPLSLPNKATSLSDIAQLIFRHGTPDGQRLFRNAIERADYPQLVVLSMPEAPAGAGRRLAAVRIKRPDSRLLKEAKRGFRPGRVPVGRVLSRIAREPVERLNLKRVDRAYLVARGGAAGRLAQAVVTVVGVGAVGSEVALNLAALGVGHIRLVDPDDMNPENVHRHALGMSGTGYSKAAELTVELWRSFPHQDADCRVAEVQALLATEPTFVLEADLIVLATGEETLERRLNRLLQSGPPRLHTWLEPLGIAGHAFVCGGRMGDGDHSGYTRGCFECLYRPDEVVGLVNRTALTGAGQDIRRSLAGCAGTFSPFSPLDARRTADLAADLAAQYLTSTIAPPLLVSWRGLHTEFEAANYRLSGRASQIRPGARVEVSGVDLIRDDCPICGAHVRQVAVVAGVATGDAVSP